MNPFHHHCGPFNKILADSSGLTDKACRDHDITYGEMQELKSNVWPYTHYNIADERFLNTQKNSIYTSFFRAKRKIGQIGISLARAVGFDPYGYSGGSFSKRTKLNTGQLSFQANAPLLDMARRRYKRRKVVRRYKKRYGRKAKRPMYRKKGRFKRRGKFSGFKQMMRMLEPRQMNRVRTLVARQSAGDYAIIAGGIVADFESYRQASVSQGNSGETIIRLKNEHTKQYRIYAEMESVIQNQNQQDLYVRPVFYWCKRDYRDEDFNVQENRVEGEKSLMTMFLRTNTQRTPAGVDGDDCYKTLLSGSDERRAEQFLVCWGLPWMNSQMKWYLKFKFGSGRVLEPGKEARVKLTSKKIKRIFPLHVAVETNNHPTWIGGHTMGVLWIVQTPMVGTDEANSGNEQNLKIAATGNGFQAIKTKGRMVFKRQADQFQDVHYNQRVGNIAEANVIAMVEDEFQPVHPQHVEEGHP